MNSEQIKRLVTWAMTGIGSFLMGWAASRGWQFGDLFNQILSSELVIGLVVTLVTGVVTWLSGRVPWLVAVMDALAKSRDTPVQAVIMSPTAEGAQIANSLPGNTTVVAGTGAATEMAKAA